MFTIASRIVFSSFNQF
jgi:hypothetical protein